MFTKPPQVFYSFFLDYSANDNKHLVREIIHKYTKQSQPVQPEAEGDPSPVGGTIPDKVPVSSLMPAATLVSGPSHVLVYPGVLFAVYNTAMPRSLKINALELSLRLTGLLRGNKNISGDVLYQCIYIQCKLFLWFFKWNP